MHDQIKTVFFSEDKTQAIEYFYLFRKYIPFVILGLLALGIRKLMVISLWMALASTHPTGKGIMEKITKAVR